MYKLKEKERINHLNLPNPKLNISINFSKEFLSQAKFHLPKLPIEVIQTRNLL